MDLDLLVNLSEPQFHITSAGYNKGDVLSLDPAVF